MKIAFFLTQFQGGGAERETINIANGLVDRGFDVHFLCGVNKGPFANQLRDEVTLVQFNKTRSIACLLPLWRYLRKEEPELLYTALSTANFVNVFVNKVLGTGVKSLIIESSTPSVQFSEGRGFRNRAVKWLTKWSFSNSDKVVSVSKEAAADVRSFYNLDTEKVRCIYNPVIFPGMYSKARENVDHPWFLHYKVLVSVGRIQEVKDYGTLLHALRIINQDKEKPVKLIILGVTVSENYYTKLLNLAKELGVDDDVDFVGFKPNPFSYLKKASVYVCSSKREGLPSAIIQALGLNKKIVSTNCTSGPKEILGNGKYGYLVDVGDYKSMADKIELALESAERSIPSEATEPYTYERVISEYADFIRNDFT